jgi:RNA polymerase sigma factor (sigma-70 family)
MAGHSLSEMRNSGPSDPELLAEWLKHRREPAFHELVARYAGLVHATARRTCGDESMAGEVSQLTFITLARKAKSLTTCASLGGWLHRTAMMHAKNIIRQNHRENRKRQHLAMEPVSQDHPGDAWLEMQPVLDEALAALSDIDREALLLRFYRSLSVREVAATLGIATDAAQKRIDRATERLRGKLTRRGCQSGGTLAATLLAGFSADSQATLPVSILASKAIAAGAIGSFSLTAILATAAALMKSSSLILPAVALVLAGAWTGTKYQALSASEARNGLLREEIAAARSVKTPASFQLTKDDGPIDWQKLATEGDNGPEKQRFERRLKSMTREEMIAALDQIAALEVSNKRRGTLEWTVGNPLMQIDPEWVLNRFTDRLRDDPNQQQLLLRAFEIWAKRDLVKATAWFDRQIAAGAFDGRALDRIRGSKTRFSFEAALLDLLLAFDSGFAEVRLGAMPETERMEVMDCFIGRLRNQRLEERHHMAEFADLVRTQLPAGQQVAVLFRGAPYSRVLEDYPIFSTYLEKIEATQGERMSCTEKFAGDKINWISQHRKVNRQDIDAVRGWFREISPESVDSCTGRALTEAMSNRVSSMRLAQASEIAVELLEVEGADEVLATLLETTKLDKPEVKLALELTHRITDETRRAVVVKHLESLTFPW